MGWEGCCCLAARCHRLWPRLAAGHGPSLVFWWVRTRENPGWLWVSENWVNGAALKDSSPCFQRERYVCTLWLLTVLARLPSWWRHVLQVHGTRTCVYCQRKSTVDGGWGDVLWLCAVLLSWGRAGTGEKTTRSEQAPREQWSVVSREKCLQPKSCP